MSVIEIPPAAPPSLPPPGSVAQPRRPRPTPRRVSKFAPDDWASLLGALAGSAGIITIIYYHVLATSGPLGFLVCWWLTFLVLYAVAVALSNPRPIVVERLVTATLWTIAGVVVFALLTVLVYVFARGWPAYHHLNFFTHDASGLGATTPLNQTGILHAIVGTLIEVGIAVAFSLPLGIGTAVFMTEVGGRLARLVKTVIDAMTALPEILAALFIYAVAIIALGIDKSGIAASAAMAVTMVPIIARASEVALRIVPQSLREASMALGSTRWRTVRKVVLPTARAGLATGVLLGIARGIGETAVPLICSVSSNFLAFNPIGKPMNSLPLYILTAEKTGEHLEIVRAFGAGSVLLALVGILFVGTRILTSNRTAQR